MKRSRAAWEMENKNVSENMTLISIIKYSVFYDVTVQCNNFSVKLMQA